LIKKGMKIITKHVPLRTCISCRQVKAKGELVRLVRVGGGRVEVDVSGKKAGRGAYLCPAPECWQVGLSGGRLEHSLGATISPEDREQLIRSAKMFIGGNSSG
jgi:predicted RNA-binding protein YlxR (DUF448 family)